MFPGERVGTGMSRRDMSREVGEGSDCPCLRDPSLTADRSSVHSDSGAMMVDVGSNAPFCLQDPGQDVPTSAHPWIINVLNTLSNKHAVPLASWKIHLWKPYGY